MIVQSVVNDVLDRRLFCAHNNGAGVGVRHGEGMGCLNWKLGEEKAMNSNSLVRQAQQELNQKYESAVKMESQPCTTNDEPNSRLRSEFVSWMTQA